MYFRLLHNIYYCSVFYSFLYKASLFLLVLSFFLYLRGKEKKERTKEKKKARHCILWPNGGFTPIRPFLFLGFAQSLLPRKLVLRTQTVLGIHKTPPLWGRGATHVVFSLICCVVTKFKCEAKVGASCERVRSTIANIIDSTKSNKKHG